MNHDLKHTENTNTVINYSQNNCGFLKVVIIIYYASFVTKKNKQIYPHNCQPCFVKKSILFLRPNNHVLSNTEKKHKNLAYVIIMHTPQFFLLCNHHYNIHYNNGGMSNSRLYLVPRYLLMAVSSMVHPWLMNLSSLVNQCQYLRRSETLSLVEPLTRMGHY